MWVATMGQKTVGTTNLPDVQNVVVSKSILEEVYPNLKMVQFGLQVNIKT